MGDSDQLALDAWGEVTIWGPVPGTQAEAAFREAPSSLPQRPERKRGERRPCADLAMMPLPPQAWLLIIGWVLTCTFFPQTPFS